MIRLFLHCFFCFSLLNQMVVKESTAQVSSPQKPASAEKTSQARDIAFDVVSIQPVEKPDPLWQIGAQIMPTPDGYKGGEKQTLWSTIMFAYYQYSHSPLYWKRSMLSGAPAWLIKNEYVINAKVAPEDVELWQRPDPDRVMLRGALQKMLKDRCKLVIHSVMTEQPVLALMVRPGAKLKLIEASRDEVVPSDARRIAYDGAVKNSMANGIDTDRYYGMSIGYLAAHLGGDRPILDRTGLKGRYDFELHLVIDDENDPMATHWDIENLGLMLKPTKAPVETLVIDHIDEPTAN